jgi:hypothetical protein
MERSKLIRFDSLRRAAWMMASGTLLLWSWSGAAKARLFTLEAPPGGTSTSMGRTVKSAHAVRVSPASLQEESLEIPLPSGEIQGIRRTSLQQDSAGYTIWNGASEADAAETATLVERFGKMHGTLRLQGKVYSVEPTGRPGEHLLLERDFSGLEECVTEQGDRK